VPFGGGSDPGFWAENQPTKLRSLPGPSGSLFVVSRLGRAEARRKVQQTISRRQTGSHTSHTRLAPGPTSPGRQQRPPWPSSCGCVCAAPCSVLCASSRAQPSLWRSRSNGPQLLCSQRRRGSKGAGEDWWGCAPSAADVKQPPPPAATSCQAPRLRRPRGVR
jgi:hypothetical protein